MPLYEGIGLISEKHAVVLDIGAAYTKCGYAGPPQSSLSGLWIRFDSSRIQKFSSIRIRIHNVIESGSNPDPQQYFRRQIFSKIKKSTKK
jgi:hypothetical protein